MKKGNDTNATFVTRVLVWKEILRNILKWFMKTKGLTNVIFVSMQLPKIMI
jgi:hypothetical protein